jgi:hypothetical protein
LTNPSNSHETNPSTRLSAHLVPGDSPDVMHNPIFLVGAMRSGTTLVRLVLDSHENIAIPRETGFMRLVQAQKFTPFWKWGDDWHEHLGLSESDLDTELRDFYGRLFARHARAEGKSRWGDKTPWHVWHIGQMAHMWPHAVFVGVVRHPGGTVGSLTTSWKSFTVPRAIRLWQRTNLELVRQAALLGDRLTLLRYEDVLQSPEATLRELLDWLGEPWSPQVLAHHEVQQRRGGPSQVEGRTRTDQPMDVSRTTKWATAMPPADLRRVRRGTETLARFLGYSFDDVSALEPLVPAGSTRSHLVTGTEVGARAEHWPEPLGLDHPPAAPLTERRYNPSKVTLQRARSNGSATARSADGRTARQPLDLRRRVRRRLRPVIVRTKKRL